MGDLAARVDKMASSLPVRLLLPIIFILFHLFMLSALAEERFKTPFNAAPGMAPTFSNPAVDPIPAHWNRLVVSRWDAQHYITIGLRGYQYCAPREVLGPDHYPDSDVVCQLNFLPGYAVLGGVTSRLLHVPIDSALFGISLIASYAAMFLWTSKEIVSALGGTTTLLSLLLYNVFTTGFSLVTVQTEPCALLLIMATFVLLQRRHFAFAALCAGAAGIVRPTGVATSAAFALALLYVTARERPPVRVMVWRAALAVVAGWGLIVLLFFYEIRFGDALVYAHARERYYHYLPNPLALLWPSYKWLSQSLWAAPNEGMWLAAGLLWFAMGYKKAMAGFTGSGKVYWYATYLLVVFIAAAGQVTIGFSGMSRYLLLAVPLFFAMAAAMRNHPLALALWVIICVAHYWSVGACFYIGQGQPGFWQVCHFQPGA